MVLECNIDLSVRLDIIFPQILLTEFVLKEKKDSEAPLGFSVCFDVPSDRIGVPPFVTSSHLLVVPPPSLSGVMSFMDGP